MNLERLASGIRAPLTKLPPFPVGWDVEGCSTVSRMPHHDYPVQKLLFFVAQDFEDSLPEVIERFTEDLSSSRGWSVAGPVFVNETTDGLPTLGGYLSLYSALPPNELPTEPDRLNLEEVKELIRGLETLTREHQLAIDLELDGVPVGSVEDGKSDRTLNDGLIREWERVLTEREKQEHSGES